MPELDPKRVLFTSEAEFGVGELPCWNTHHQPFYVKAESNDQDQVLIYGAARTTSWSFSGERTDLHDVLSCYFAALIRVRYEASVRLIDVYNPAVYNFGELYGRELILAQPRLVVMPRDLALPAYERFLNSAAVATHEADDIFNLEGDDEAEPVPTYDEPEWATAVRKAIGTRAKDTLSTSRNKPSWEYLNFPRRRISIARINESDGQLLRENLGEFPALKAPGPDRMVFRTGQILNAVSHNSIEIANKIITAVEGKPVLEPLLIPVESHLIAFGDRTMVSIGEDCGLDAFEDERVGIERQRDAQALVFFTDARFEWSLNLDDGRFQRLVLELLERERGVRWVREVGSARDRDGGRDLIVEWDVEIERTRTRISNGEAILQRRQVLVQVKTRRESVNKADVMDIRDTLEQHECDGFLLVAHPRITAPLFDHLTSLRKRSRYWVDWWEQPQIERRLRERPDIATRFSDVITLER